MFAIILKWYIGWMAKKHPEKDTKEIVEDFLKENNLDVNVNITSDVGKSKFVPLYQIDRVVKRLDRLSEDKKQKMIDRIEKKTGIKIEDIQPQIVTTNRVAIGLHEAGHAKDFNGTNAIARTFFRKMSPIAGQVITSLPYVIPDTKAAKFISKAEIPIMLASLAPAISQEYKANAIAYNELKKRYGEDVAKKKYMTELVPGMATYVTSNIVEPMIFMKLFGNALQKVGANAARKMHEKNNPGKAPVVR